MRLRRAPKTLRYQLLLPKLLLGCSMGHSGFKAVHAGGRVGRPEQLWPQLEYHMKALIKLRLLGCTALNFSVVRSSGVQTAPLSVVVDECVFVHWL